MHNQNKEGVDLDVLLNQAGTTARLGSEKHCRDLLLEIEKLNLARRAEPSVAAGDDDLNGGMHASIFVKVWGDAGGGDAGRIALANYAFELGKRAALASPAIDQPIATVGQPSGAICQPAAVASPAVSQQATLIDALKQIDGIAQVLLEGGYGKDGDRKAYADIAGLAQTWLRASSTATTASASDLTMSMFATRQDFDDAIKGTAHTCGLAGEHFGVCPHCRAQAPSREAAPEIKTWQKRADELGQSGRRQGYPDTDELEALKDAEIADLRAALANSGASHAGNAGEDEKHLHGWERGIATVTMTGHQLREALDFLNPGGDDEPDERDDELTFGIVKVADDAGNVSAGLCCWNDDSDGVLPLDAYPDDRTAIASSAEQDAKHVE